MYKTACTLALATCAFFALAQSNTPPKVTIKGPGTAKHGEPVKVTVQITFAEGLHGYQNPPSNPDLIPVKVSLDTKGVSIKSINYPVGKDEAVGGDPTKVRVYENTISVPVTIIAPKKKGKVSLAFKVSYQQCNSQSCYPPSDVSGTIPLTVK